MEYWNRTLLSVRYIERWTDNKWETTWYDMWYIVWGHPFHIEECLYWLHNIYVDWWSSLNTGILSNFWQNSARARSQHQRPFPVKGGTRCQKRVGEPWNCTTRIKQSTTTSGEQIGKQLIIGSRQPVRISTFDGKLIWVLGKLHLSETTNRTCQADTGIMQDHPTHNIESKRPVDRSSSTNGPRSSNRPSKDATRMSERTSSQESREVSRANFRNWQHHHCVRTRITTIKCKDRQVSAMKRSLIKLKLKKCNDITDAHVPFPGNDNWTKGHSAIKVPPKVLWKANTWGMAPTWETTAERFNDLVQVIVMTCAAIWPPPSEDTSNGLAKTNAWRQITGLQPSTAHTTTGPWWPSASTWLSHREGTLHVST